MNESRITRWFCRGLTFSVFLATGASAQAQDCDNSPASLEGLPIVEISIDNRDIFDNSDPRENLWIHTTANRLHINTREQTIEDDLLFKVGDPYRKNLANETERLLRSRDYLHHVDITAEPICGEGVRVEVVTSDNWTLTPSISANRSGGETRTAIELEEANLFGFGTELKLISQSDEDRETNAIYFRDPNWIGDFKGLDIQLEDNSDGHRYYTSVSRPFVQEDSHYSWSANALSLERENPIYEAGIRVGEVGEKRENYSLSYGWSGGVIDQRVHRHRLGWVYDKTDYFTVSDPEIPVPEHRENSYPFYEYEYRKVQYTERINFLVMGVTEDIQLGTRFGFGFGWKDEAFDSSQPGPILSMDYDFGHFISSKTLAIFRLDLAHETNETIDDKGRFDGQTRFYHYLDQNNSYLFSARFQAALNPELFERIYVGGDSGLKGYPIRFQAGDRAVTLSVERRIYFNAYLWRLVKFGFAVFGEMGSAWDSEEDPVWLGDVGAGFRVVSTRQSNARVLHIDLAFPLSETSTIDSYQFYVRARAEF